MEIGRQRTRFLATSPRHADAARMAKIHIVHIAGVVFGETAYRRVLSLLKNLRLADTVSGGSSRSAAKDL